MFASSGNPVQAGLVASFGRPGGNVTGFTILGPELEGKRLELLKETVSGLSRVVVLWNPSNLATTSFYEQTQAAAAALAVTILAVKNPPSRRFEKCLFDDRQRPPTCDDRAGGSLNAGASHATREFCVDHPAAGHVPVPGV